MYNIVNSNIWILLLICDDSDLLVCVVNTFLLENINDFDVHIKHHKGGWGDPVWGGGTNLTGSENVRKTRPNGTRYLEENKFTPHSCR